MPTAELRFSCNDVTPHLQYRFIARETLGTRRCDFSEPTVSGDAESSSPLFRLTAL